MATTAAPLSTTAATPPSIVPLDSPDYSDWPTVGSRGARLARASRMGLPVPTGVVLPTHSIGALEPGEVMDRTEHPLKRIFDETGNGGRAPLSLSLSSIAPPNSSADRVPAVRDVTTLSELIHTVRRFSVTSTILGDSIAIVVQRDIAPVSSGQFVIQPKTNYNHPINNKIPQPVRRRLMSLGRDVGRIFLGTHTLIWAIDVADKIWILDIGPEHIS